MDYELRIPRGMHIGTISVLLGFFICRFLRPTDATIFETDAIMIV